MNRQKILLVEDEIGIAEMFRGFLEDAYDVSVFTNPSEALSELSGTGKTYDIIITDLKMPGVSGMEILDKAKQADRYTEVIIITGYGTLESASEAVNRGAMSYLLKPVSVPDFLTQVEKASSRREFNRKSAELIESIPEENTGLREHAVIFRNLHDFSTELTKTLEYEELVKLVLREFCTRTGTDTAYLITDHGLELKLYLYGVSSEAGEETLYNAADKASGIWNRYNEDAAADPLTISRIVLSPSSGGCPSPVFEKTISVPLIFMG
ncbi:MAG: response regulator, partial [Fibrobacterota bacterium]